MGEHLTTPMPREVARGADLLVVERWAERQRTELQRLLDELRRLHDRLDEVAAADVPGEPPAALFPLIDEMLGSAIERLDAETVSANAAADRTIDLAARDAAALLRQHKVDDDVIDRITDPAPRVIRELRRPRCAAELWRDLVPAAPALAGAAGADALGPVDQPSAPTPAEQHADLPSSASLDVVASPSVPSRPPVTVPAALRPHSASAAEEPVGPTRADRPAPDAAAGPAAHAVAASWALRPSAPKPGTALAPRSGAAEAQEELVDVRTGGASHLHAHDQFWATLPPDRPVRERIRRFAQRSPQ